MDATYYHSFCGIVGQTKWHYMGTICQFGINVPTQVSAHIEASEHNNHLYTRVFKYGNGWDFDDKGDVLPITKMNCYSDDYNNSKTIYDTQLHRVKMYFGGGVHTSTPSDYYTFKQMPKNAPKVPFGFNLSNYISSI